MPIGLAGGYNLYAYVGGDPVSLTDALGLRPLYDREKCLLQPYIPQVDLDNADFRDGEVPWYLPAEKDGITRGNTIYVRPGAYDGSTPGGIAFLGHELVHVGQYREGATWLSFLWSYRNGYYNSKYEREAYDLQDKILRELTANGQSGCTCP